MHDKGLSTAVGDERGFAPDLAAKQRRRIGRDYDGHRKGGLQAGRTGSNRARCASTEFYDKDEKSTLEGKAHSSDDIIALLSSWVEKYPICSIEDGCAEDDWDGWKAMTEAIGDKVQLVGDDLFVTNVKRLQRGIDRGIGNSILIKVNQIGTLSETIDAV